MSRVIFWLALGALVVLNVSFGERWFGNQNGLVTAGLIVVAAVVFIWGLFSDRAKKRNLEDEMKRVDEVMRKTDDKP